MTSHHIELSKDSLLLIPCSGKKDRNGDQPGNGRTILAALDPALASALSNARAALRAKAQVTDTQMPAYRRYIGHLYQQCAADIEIALAARQQIAIVSGAYGLLLPDEGIGSYKMRMTLSEWKPKGLLQDCILDYALREGIRSVIAVMSHSTDYAKLVRRIKWAANGIEAVLLTPNPGPGPPREECPRAEGQAISALLNGGLDTMMWRSSDSLSLSCERLLR